VGAPTASERGVTLRRRVPAGAMFGAEAPITHSEITATHEGGTG
jgi:hypothetical protein